MGVGPGTMGLSLAAFLALWVVMMTAMMFPSVAPDGHRVDPVGVGPPDAGREGDRRRGVPRAATWSRGRRSVCWPTSS